MKGPPMFIPILATVVALAVVAPPPSQPVSVIERAVSQISDIDWTLDEKRGGHCTGVQIGIRWILTAEHCLPPKDVNVDITANGTPVRVLKRSAELDLAILETPGDATNSIMEIRKSPPKLGEEVAAVGLGWGPGNEGRVIPPMVLRRSIARIGANGYIYTDGSFIPGMSGGPLVDVDGKLIGVVRQGWDEIAIGGVIPAKAVRGFIDGK